MKNLRIKLTWLLGMLLLTPGVSLAGWYVGAGAGQTNTEVESSFDTGAGESISDSDSSSKVFGGFGFSNHFAVEFGYADLGEYTADIPADPVYITMESTAIFVELVGSAKVHDRVDIFGKLGVAQSDSEMTMSNGVISYTGDNASVNPVVGIGFDFNVTKLAPGGRFDVRLEWEQYQNVGEGVEVSPFPGAGIEMLGNAIDVFGISVIFHF